MNVPSKKVRENIIGVNNGHYAAFIKIPFDVKEFFGSGKPKVNADFGEGVTYSGSLVKMKTPYHILLLRKDIRATLGLSIGDPVEVIITLDTAPREVEVPGQLLEALEKNQLLETFSKSSFTFRKESANAVEGAKKLETKLNRIDKIIVQLKTKN